MKKIQSLFLLSLISFIILFGCNSITNGAIKKASVSKSSGFGKITSDFFAVFEDKEALQTFQGAISTASKQQGIVDIMEPDYDIEIIYKDSKIRGYHLWLSEKGETGTLMDINDTNTIYTISQGWT